MITALRLYLSAQTPQRGMNGSPVRKKREPSQPTKGGDIWTRDADLGQAVWQEGVDLSHSETLDERGDPVEDQQTVPIWHGREAHLRSLAESRRGGRTT
jgi:hypothetical protein